jgi:hypothetical protein
VRVECTHHNPDDEDHGSDICGFSVLDDKVSQLTELNIQGLIISEIEDSHHHVLYPTDCLVLNFDSIQAVEDLNPNTYYPFPNDISCEIDKVTCSKISGSSILL